MSVQGRTGALLLAALLFFHASAWAQAAADPPAPPSAVKKRRAAERPSRPPLSVSGSFGLQAIYDDNFLRMSDGTILDFRRNANPAKFHIETYDDLILSPRLSLTVGRRLIGSRETTLRFGYIRWQYARNGIKNNESYTIRVRQPTQGRNFLEASYNYAPFGYIRHLSDRAPFVPRSTPLEWIPFKITRNAFTLGYSHRISERITARVDGGRTLRFYNRPFMENDNREWNATGTASLAVSRTLKATGQYEYARTKTRSLDTAGETYETSDDSDASYERDLYELTLDVNPRNRLWKVRLLEVVGQYQAYYFTSKMPPYEDPLHTGRKDNVYAFEANAETKPVYGPVTLVAGWRYSQRTSSLPATVSAEDAEDKDYKDNRIWVGASYPF